jgi:hypothetical protein
MKEIAMVIVALALCSFSVWDITQGGGLTAWGGALLFGVGTVIYILQPMRRNRKRTADGADRSIDRINDTGIFRYTDNGFILETDSGRHHVKWEEINSMFAYKVDQYVVDTIVLEVFCTGNLQFTITEETHGWFQFTQRSKKALPSIAPAWDVEIAVPAFETKFTLVYDRLNRSLEEAGKQYYQD